MRKKQLDERELNLRRQVASEAMGITQYALLLAIIIQMYFLGKDFEAVAAEFYVILISSVYILIRNLVLGNSIYEKREMGQGTVFLFAGVTSLTILIVNISQNYFNSGSILFDDTWNTILVYGVTALSGFIAALVPGEIMYYLNQMRQKQIAKKYEEK